MVQDPSLQEKVEFLLGYYLKFVIQWGQWTFGGGSLLGKFWLVKGTSLHHKVGKTLSSGFILKIILPRVGIQCIAWGVYKNIDIARG